MVHPELKTVAEAYDDFHGRRPWRPTADDPWHLWMRAVLQPEDLRGKRVLETGCGRGGFSLWLASETAPRLLVASDLSLGALRQARAANEGFPGPAGWTSADVARLPFASGTFDVVFCMETVEHLVDPQGAVRELARVIAPGGRLFLTTPSYLNLMGLYRGYLRLWGRKWDEGGQPIARFTMLPRTLAWLRAAGFEIQKVDGMGHYVPFPRRSPIRVWSLDSTTFRPVLKWLGLHSSVIALKPQR